MRRLVHHASHHILIHLGLFAGFALLIPVMSNAFDQKVVPWVLAPSIFFGGMMLIVISAFLLYRVKESFSGMLKSLGVTIFIPGALSLLTGVLNITDVLKANSSVTGMAVIGPVAEFYVSHSVPTILSVAAIYLFVGGVLYWVGNKMQAVQDKFSMNR